MSKPAIMVAVLTILVLVVYVEVRLGGSPDPDLSPTAPPATPALEARLDRIEEMLLQLRNAPRGITTEAEPATAGGGSKANSPADPAASSSGEAAEASPEQAERVKEFIARVEAGEVVGEEMNQLWSLLRGSGLYDEALSALAKNARAQPRDPDAQYGVGIAAISKLVSGQVSFGEQGELSMIADAAFTKALDIDDHHFGARFSKAVSYTYWPEAMGKGPAAIAEFEILRKQSAQDSSVPMLDQVYTNLGIQYRKIGNFEKSREALEEGLRLFPDSKEIKEQLKALGD